MRICSMLLLAVSLSMCDIDQTTSEVKKTKPGSRLSVSLDKHKGNVCFHNAGPDSVYILKPLDGSVNCWIMPYYRFTVRDPDGQPLKFSPRCGHHGLWWKTKWPQDYLVEIKPGTTYSMVEWWEGYYEVVRDGPHTISFEYVYQPTKEGLEPPPKAWRGTVVAPDIIVNFKNKKRQAR